MLCAHLRDKIKGAENWWAKRSYRALALKTRESSKANSRMQHHEDFSGRNLFLSQTEIGHKVWPREWNLENPRYKKLEHLNKQIVICMERTMSSLGRLWIWRCRQEYVRRDNIAMHINGEGILSSINEHEKKMSL